LCLNFLYWLFIFAFHHPAQSAACQSMQLITYSCATFARRLTVIEAL
jgi:hypothetical protein